MPCEACADGMTVEVDVTTIYESDALVRCGAPLPDDAIKVTDPVIVVEVLSPSSRSRDVGAKLEDYFRLPSTCHYLIVKTENRTVIHHASDAAGAIATRIIKGDTITLDPPGIALRDIFS
ncbi:MAG: Uma2 family endonuclease [Acetobacteraceae bacterium]